jgi:chromosome segregation ATPase
MEFEQIIKRLDWLDEQRRKDKDALAEVTDKLAGLETENKVLRQAVKELTAQISGFGSVPGRVDQFESALEKQRKDIHQYIGGLEKNRDTAQLEAEKRYRVEFDGINRTIAELRTIKDPIAEIKREIKAFNEEETRLNRLIAEARVKSEEIVHAAEDLQRQIRSFEESRKQDSKRVTDMQGETTALRKRLDEVREKTELFPDNIRRIEVRLNEILTSEADRRQAQTAFIESQSRMTVERERAWKDWQARFDEITKQSVSIETQIQQWDSVQRSVRRAQEMYEEIVQKFERRINEITEIQRLAEDRFRQEWVTFKADDQKRWTSFTLSQDESHKEARIGIDKLDLRITSVEDLVQTQQDILQQTKEANEQLLHGILSQLHEMLTAYERITGTAK